MHIRKLPSTPANKSKLKLVTKNIKARVKTVQNAMLKEKGKQLNELKEQRKIAKLWKTAKTHDSVIHSKPKSIQCPGLATHFQNHFNPEHSTLQEPYEITHIPDYIQILQDSSNEMVGTPPSKDEISSAIKQLNGGKSSLDVEPEIIKLADTIPNFKTAIEHYFHKIWSELQIPKQWRTSKITPIWKRKGSASDPSKYRGISNGSILCKVGMNIILKRMSSFYETQLKNTQFGFRRGAGCNDAIYMLKQLQEIASISERKLYACFIDLTAAFDHVNRALLFKTIKNRLASAQSTINLDIIEKLYQSTTSYLQDENPETDSFETSSGVRQGGMEGPPLYNLFSDYSLRVYEDRRTQEGVTGLSIPYAIPNEATNRRQRETAPTNGICNDAEEGYADDLGVFSWTESDLSTSLNVLSEVFKEFGLNINLDKTETMIFNWNEQDQNNYPKFILTLNGKQIKNSTSFKYLGVWINHNELAIGKEEIGHRINSAHSAFAQNRKMLTNKNIKLDTRIMFLNSLVRSRLTYGCHAWRPSSSEISKLDATYRYFLRCMVWNGFSRVNAPSTSFSTQSSTSEESTNENEIEYDWRYIITNRKLEQLTRTKPISSYYRLQQQNWVAHVIRRENNNPCKMLTFYNINRKKRGRRSPSILDRAVQHSGLTINEFISKCFMKQNPQR